MNTCGKCRWRKNCLNMKYITGFVRPEQGNIDLTVYIMEAPSDSFICREFERADGTRNPKATCGDCPYGYSDFANTDTHTFCRYDRCVNERDSIPLSHTACRHHPQFWMEN